MHYTERQLEVGLRDCAGWLSKRTSLGQADERGGHEQAGSPWPRLKRLSLEGTTSSCLCLFMFVLSHFSFCLSLPGLNVWPFKAFQLIRSGPPKISTLIKVNKLGLFVCKMTPQQPLGQHVIEIAGKWYKRLLLPDSLYRTDDLWQPALPRNTQTHLRDRPWWLPATVVKWVSL